MIELQKYIVSQLKTIHPEVYLENAKQGAPYPHIVYRLPTSNESERREDFILEINVWDQREDGSTIPLEDITSQIDQLLNRSRYVSPDGWSTRIYRTNRLMVPDPDVTIHRRQLRYECKTYVTGGR